MRLVSRDGGWAMGSAVTGDKNLMRKLLPAIVIALVAAGSVAPAMAGEYGKGGYEHKYGKHDYNKYGKHDYDKYGKHDYDKYGKRDHDKYGDYRRGGFEHKYGDNYGKRYLAQ